MISEYRLMLFILASGHLATVLICALHYWHQCFRFKRSRHAPAAEWNDHLMYLGIGLSWCIAEGVSFFLY